MKTYIVAYSYQDKFEISEEIAGVLITAKKTKVEGVQVGARYYTTNFLWVMPKEETNQKLLSAKQLILAGEVAKWLSDPIHELGWSENAAVEYSMKLLRRCDYKEIKGLWNIYALGSYPDAKKFLMEAKQLENAPNTPQIEANLLP